MLLLPVQNRKKLPTMRLIINLVLLVIVAALVYVLIDSIREPIAFKNERDKREDAVVDRLRDLRRGQELYRTISGGEFASNWDDYKNVLSTGQIPFVKVIGDPDDPEFQGEVTYDTTYSSAADSIKSLGWDLDEMVLIPFGNGKMFDEQLIYEKEDFPTASVKVADLNNDGFLDIVNANGDEINYAYINIEGKSFERTPLNEERKMARPDNPGNIRSSSNNSKSPLSISSSATLPSAVQTVAYPSDFRARWRKSAMRGSSSTIRTLMLPLAASHPWVIESWL